jgi:aminoglycoside phosphotransferase (APT) family kinase protein
VLLRGSGRVGKIFLPRADGIDRADREIAALQLLADSPIPVPALVDCGAAAGCRWLLMSELPGMPMRVRDYGSPAGLAFQRFRGRMSAMIHTAARPQAFGVWTVDPYRSSAEWARRESAGRAEHAVAVRPERSALSERLRRLQESWLDAIDVAAPVLVHGDLGPENFLVDAAERVAGVLDWETAVGSLPAADFAGTALFGGAGLTAFAEGYGAGAGAVLPEQLGYFVIDRILQVFGTTGGRWNPGLDHVAESMADRLLSGDLEPVTLPRRRSVK